MAAAPTVIDKNSVVVRAREMRRRPSLPEGLLWRELRKRPDGLKFRRQHPLGWYIADFYCPAVRLVVEVDGESHAMGERPAHDARRDEWMQAQGFRVIRPDAADIVKDLESALTAIRLACRR